MNKFSYPHCHLQLIRFLPRQLMREPSINQLCSPIVNLCHFCEQYHLSVSCFLGLLDSCCFRIGKGGKLSMQQPFESHNHVWTNPEKQNYIFDGPENKWPPAKYEILISILLRIAHSSLFDICHIAGKSFEYIWYLPKVQHKNYAYHNIVAWKRELKTLMALFL